MPTHNEIISEARELEAKVKELYFSALSTPGRVTLKLMYPQVTIPEIGKAKWRGDLATEIAHAIMDDYSNSNWTVWLKSNKKTKRSFVFAIESHKGINVDHEEVIPWSFGTKADAAYYLYKTPDDLPF